MTTVAVITGAARGMGLACARRLEGGCDVLLLSDQAPFEPRELGLGGNVEVIQADLSSAPGVAALAARAASLGEVRWVVHAAGVSPTMGDARRMFDVDLLGPALVVDAFEPLVVDGGAAVLLASMAGHLVASVVDPTVDEVLADPLAPGAAERFVAAPPVHGDPSMAYSFAKRGVVRLARRRAPAWAARGARINSVSPGSIDTPMGAAELEGQPAMRTLLGQTPIPRLGTADEIAAAVAFLLSDGASYVTGTDLLIDGGLVASLDG